MRWAGPKKAPDDTLNTLDDDNPSPGQAVPPPARSDRGVNARGSNGNREHARVADVVIDASRAAATGVEAAPRAGASHEGPRRADARGVNWVRAAVERYETQLTLYARHVLGGDLERARDVVQEAFLRLIGQDRGKVEPHLTEWLYTVCRNLAIDVRRKERRVERLSDAVADSSVSDAPDPDARSEHDDVLTHVLRTLQRLPKNQQECVRLKFQGDLSYKQISEVTGLTVTNVGFLIHTGLKTLRQKLASAPQGGPEGKPDRQASPTSVGRKQA